MTKLQKVIRELNELTPAEILAFLVGRGFTYDSDNPRVNRCRACPIALYLSASTGIQVSVGSDNAWPMVPNEEWWERPSLGQNLTEARKRIDDVISEKGQWP